MSQNAVNAPAAQNIGINLVRIAAVYLLIGLVMGILMGMTGDFSLSSVHAHITLLGWAAMSVTGIVYILVPGCRRSKLAGLHFWGHNLGLPVMMISLALFVHGFPGAEKTIAAGSMLVFLSLAAFTINLYRNAGQHAFAD